MPAQIQLGDLALNVARKEIKNIHLSVHPPTGRITISAPHHLSLDTIRVFAIAKVGWIRQQQQKLQGQERETPREYIERESHYVWGRRYLLHIVEADAAPLVELTPRRLILRVRPGSTAGSRATLLDAWYRTQVREAAQPLIKKWQPLMGVTVARIFIQRMKTKWGSCNHSAGAIRLNSDLAKKPRQCLEYIVVHEMTHLLVPTHNARFLSLMDQLLPKWQSIRATLNRLPVRHDNWNY
jgi:predicted metal-dependent hydrolase